MKGKEIIEYIVRADMPDLERVRERCHGQSLKTKPIFKKRFIIVIAVIAILFTVVVYGGTIQRFFVNQVPQIKISGDDTITNLLGIRDRSEEAKWPKHKSIKFEPFATYEEAREVVPFDFKIPKYLPNMVLDNVYVIYFDGTKIGYDIKIQYLIEGRYGFGLSQNYIGSKGYIEFITTWEDIQKFMIDDVEGFIFINEEEYLRMYWVKDEIMFCIECWSGLFEIETLIQIAESIE